jgi:hypothetical protein
MNCVELFLYKGFENREMKPYITRNIAMNGNNCIDGRVLRVWV